MCIPIQTLTLPALLYERAPKPWCINIITKIDPSILGCTIFARFAPRKSYEAKRLFLQIDLI